VTVTFAEEGAKTRLTMQMVFPSAASREYVVNMYGAIEGGNQTLGRLAEHLPQMDADTVKIGYAPVNGLNMYYEIRGAGRPLVLLHGGGSTIDTSFGGVLDDFAKTRQVIAFDQQGHGRTADVDRPFNFDGYSNGVSIALQVAIRHPGLARKIVAAAVMINHDGANPEFWESMKQAKLEKMPAELHEAYLKVAPHPEQLQTFFDKSVRRMLEFKDWRPEEIRSIQAPTMVLIGDADIVRPEHAVEMFRLLPRARLAVLPLTDHMTLLKRTDWLISTIEMFLDAPMPQA
jgi:pimeloyl-ACP methyl ester carboxylesterase